MLVGKIYAYIAPNQIVIKSTEIGIKVINICFLNWDVSNSKQYFAQISDFNN